MKQIILETQIQSIKPFQQLDEGDLLSHLRARFHIPKYSSDKPYIYFSGNSLGLQPDTTEQYVMEELDAWKKLGADGHFNANRPWLPYHEFLTNNSTAIFY